jgi:hypothetical protein
MVQVRILPAGVSGGAVVSMNNESSVPWLEIAVSIESAVPRQVVDATDCLDFLEVLVDGPRWLADTPFTSILLAMNFADEVRDGFTLRRRRNILEISTSVAHETLPALDAAGYQWYFFDLARQMLRAVAEKYKLSSPGFRSSSNESDGMGPILNAALPLSPGGQAAGIAAEVSSLDDDEVLVVALLPAAGDRHGDTKYIKSIDEKLARDVGAVRASASVDGAYVWAVGIEL